MCEVGHGERLSQWDIHSLLAALQGYKSLKNRSVCKSPHSSLHQLTVQRCIHECVTTRYVGLIKVKVVCACVCVHIAEMYLDSVCPLYNKYV